MPNYVLTEVNFIGSDEDFERIKKFVKSEENEFDFRKIVPYPSKSDCPKKYLLDEAFNVKEKWGDKEVISNQKAHIQLQEDCNYLDWYNWQCDNWGTKWNSMEASFGGTSVWFQTAWSFCEPIIVALSKQFPDVLIEFQFADEDIGNNCDYGWCKNGCISYADVQGNAATKLAIDIWGEEDYYEFVDGEWKYIDN